MKKIKIITLSAILTVMFVTQGNAQDNSINIAINKVIDNYIALKNALIASDGTVAENKAKELLASINSVPVKNMKAEQTALWTKYAAKLEYDSRHISEVDRVAHQREHFASLSNNLFAVLKGLKLNKEPLYREYCTTSKRYYITEDEKAKDPYTGMAVCSKTIEVIKAQ
jgi:hypothetical protein